MYSRIDVYLWVTDQCHAKPWGPCISTGSYRPKVYLWSSEAYWRELPCAHGSECPRSVVPEISADQCPALINWYLDEYWSLWHVLGIVRKVFLRAFRRILDCGNCASIRGVMAEWSLWHKCLTLPRHVVFNLPFSCQFQTYYNTSSLTSSNSTSGSCDISTNIMAATIHTHISIPLVPIDLDEFGQSNAMIYLHRYT